MRKYLLIGGPADSQRVELAEPLPDMLVVPILLDPIAPSIYLGEDCSFDIDDLACEHSEYRRQTFRVAGVDFTVYAHGSRYDLHLAIVVSDLIENYKKV